MSEEDSFKGSIFKRNLRNKLIGTYNKVMLLKTVFIKYAIELLIVAFGVFLGTYLSEWKFNERNKQNAVKSLNYIIDELNKNRNVLQTSIAYHQSLKDEIEKVQDTLKDSEMLKPFLNDESFRLNTLKTFKGLNLPIFEMVSYDGAKISGVFQQLDIESVQLISFAYNRMILKQEFGKSITQRMVNIGTSTTVGDVFATLELLTYDYLLQEELLEKQIEMILSKLKEIRKTN